MTPEGWATIVLIGTFVLLVAHQVPIAFSIGIATLLASLFLYETPDLAIYQVAKDMWHSIDNWALLAIPFFILSGLLMGKGGIARRLIDFANVLVGRFVGGLCYANVLACMFFGAISGSATAATSSIGAFLIPEMEREGYPRDFSTALTVSAATLALIIPPSNAMIVYAVAWGNVDIAALFMAGFFPGIIIGLMLMIIAGFFALRGKFKTSGAVPWRELPKRFGRAFLSLLLIVIVLGGILMGVFTATEASAAAVIYSFILAVLVYRQVSWRELPTLFIQTAVTTAFIFLLIATSSAMGKVMTRLEIPQQVSEALLGLTDNRFLLLLIINLILLFVGCFMDMTPALLIFVPIFQGLVVKTLDMHPIHFGILMIWNLCIGLCTPPVGTVLFVGCGVGGTTITKLIRPLLPFYLAMFVSLFIITYLPEDIILWLPRLVSPKI